MIKKHIVVVIGILFLVGTPALRAQTFTAEEQELIDLSTSLMHAVEQKDRPVIERLVGGNFVLNSPGDSAYAIARNDWIENSVKMDWTNLKFSNFKVRVYGDTAVVSSLLDFKVSGGKVPIPLSSNTELVDVWTRRNGQWQIDARHLGAYSIAAKLRIAAGFVAGVVCCLLIWLFTRVRRRFAKL